MNAGMWQPGKSLEDCEREIIEYALRFYGNNRKRTAESLGISARGLDYKLAKYEGTEISGASEDADSRLPSESSFELPAKQPVSLRKREEIQEVPPKSASRSASRSQ